MGAQLARELAELGSDNPRQAMEWHLTANHFPPVPTTMVDACFQAIDALNEGDYDKLIQLPEGVGYRGRVAAPASAIVEAHHLESWLAE